MNYREKTKLIDGLCGAFLMALMVEIAYVVVDYAFTIYHFSISSISNAICIVAGVVLAIAIGMLIAAYRKENGTLATYAIELLVLAITTAILPSVYVKLPMPFNRLHIVFPIAFGVYYVGKVIMLLGKNNKRNTTIFGVFETIFTLIMAYGLYNFAKPVFFAGSAVALIMFVWAMVKKNRFVLVNGIECMLVSFLMLNVTSRNFVIFLSVMLGVYYLAKAGYRFLNPVKVNRKVKRRK